MYSAAGVSWLGFVVRNGNEHPPRSGTAIPKLSQRLDQRGNLFPTTEMTPERDDLTVGETALVLRPHFLCVVPVPEERIDHTNDAIKRHPSLLHNARCRGTPTVRHMQDDEKI